MAYSTVMTFAVLLALADVEFGIVDGHSIVYVDTENGTLNNSCWKGGPDLPCQSLELGLEGAEKHDTKVAIFVKKGGDFSNTAVMPATQIRNQDNNNSSFSMSCPPPGLSTVHQIMVLVNAATPLKILLGVMSLCRNLPYLMPTA